MLLEARNSAVPEVHAQHGSKAADNDHLYMAAGGWFIKSARKRLARLGVFASVVSLSESDMIVSIFNLLFSEPQVVLKQTSSRTYCPVCRGTGHIEPSTVCPACFGDGLFGEAKLSLQKASFSSSATATLLAEFLNSAIEVTAADCGNIQLFDSSTGTLRIAAQVGFEDEFLRFFDVVHGNQAACGSALATRSRVIIRDVSSHPLFRNTSSGEVVIRAGVMAVQSTPIVGASIRIIGMLSTHYRLPGGPSRRALRELDRLTRHYAATIDEQLSRTAQLGN